MINVAQRFVNRRISPQWKPKLTKRENEILGLIAQGLSSKEVAAALFVSKRTIDFHLANTYEKLQVSNRVQAFRIAAQLGLIPYEQQPVGAI